MPGSDNMVNTLNALDDLLEQERAAVLCGNFEKMAALAFEKERLVNNLDQKSMADTRSAERIQEKLLQNSLLLRSATEGIRSASIGIEEFRKIRSGLDVYEASGKLRRFGSHQLSRLEKKA